MYENTYLKDSNIRDYTVKTYGDDGGMIKRKIQYVPTLLQNDYGELSDCTITSITAVIKFYRPDLNVFDIYDQVESIAKCYGYSGDHGTYSLTIRFIYNKALKKFGIDKRASSRYLKDFSFDYFFIQQEINGDRPVLLNLWKDGRDFYKNHTVLIVGYLMIGNIPYLMVQDNWTKTVSYIDYKKLATICSIQFLT